MSRIGKLPIILAPGVKVAVVGGLVAVEGPVGKLEFRCGEGVEVSVEKGKVLVSLSGTTAQAKSNFGTTRAIINNMAQGVAKGWKKSLELCGVGYSAKVVGAQLVLTVGYSHDVPLDIPKQLKCVVTKSIIDLESCDRELLGTFASSVRKVRPPEPYLGKGIKYTDEVIRRKAGKAGKK